MLCFWPCAGQAAGKSETIELQSILFSRCVRSRQTAEPQDLWPTRVVNVKIRRLGETVSGEYQETDTACKQTFGKSFEWTSRQFEQAKAGLQKAGLHDGMVALSESSGNDLPVSFLKVQSRGLTGEIYTMYLRFRWAGKMSTENPEAAILDEWRSLLKQAAVQVGSDVE
jgi:hypothetical protein